MGANLGSLILSRCRAIKEAPDPCSAPQVWYLALVGGFRKEIDTTKNTSLPKGVCAVRNARQNKQSARQSGLDQDSPSTATTCFCAASRPVGVTWLSGSNQTYHGNMIYGTQISVTFAFTGTRPSPLPCSCAPLASR
ncbi:hypothetical protein PpBr36_01161 [Pyricularia pennisetigena]|uniref:hypothetical protein n=1 Tax=Pyricularia pennisetigena TaxID=1578925 RepID=UPI00114E8B3C